jgi:hypothetical protein
VALNKPVIVGAAAVTVKGAERDIRLSQVQAFGANWTGSVHRASAGTSWDFDLSADRLDAADLDLWLGPADRRSLLDRILPFAAPRSVEPARAALFARIAAHGRLRVGQVLLSSIRVGRLDADAEIEGRNLDLQRAQADFYGGRVNGEFSASLAALPSYSFRGRLDHVDLGLLADSTQSLADHFAGIATGDISLAARGIGLQPLIASLEGEGVLRLRNVTMRGAGFGAGRSSQPIVRRSQLVRSGEPDALSEFRYSSAAATFHVVAAQVRLDQLLLVGRDEQLEVEGNVDFDRQMNLRARSMPRDAARPVDGDWTESDADTWTISGSLDGPQIRPQTAVAGGRPVPGGRR